MRHFHTRALLATLAPALGALALAAPLSASAAGGCPSSNALGNFKTDTSLFASIEIDPFDTASYFFTSTDEASVGGVPGLIAYCVYPPRPPGNPDGIEPLYLSGDWLGAMKPNQGYFAFVRPQGDPTNAPFDGFNYLMGTATWTDGAPDDGTRILLHINDPVECASLYGGNPGTCFVFPSLGGGPGI